MSYHEITIKEIVGKISNNEVYLPAIQRRFGWGYEQIEKLFDSIMLGYPIGTFLFWKVEKILANDYTFYKFIQEYHERDRFLNELAPKPEMKDWIIGVLDGQQRLSSMYLALQGSYAYKKPRARWDNDDAFPKRQLHLNLLRNYFNEDDGITYEFKFLTDIESKYTDEKHYWFPVKEALKWKDANDYIVYATNQGYITNTTFIQNLTFLWQRITQDRIINYFEVVAQDLDSILDIFIRVNSGGTVLSKSDLLFSTIVANWEKAREEIEELIRSINSKGDKFDFNNDFIMRLCLFVTDSPILFKVNNFRKENIDKIRNGWDEIKEALKKTIDLLVEFGFNQENLTSNNSVIPVVYHIFKGGSLTEDDKKSIRIYLITSMLKQIYGGKGDQVLDSIRNAMRKQSGNEYILKNKSFELLTLSHYKLPADKTLNFTDGDIDNIFEYKKSPYTFMVLSLLYPHLKLGQIKFHQDHLHPDSAFKNANLRKNNIDEDKWAEWQDAKDKLPNLQLLEGLENESKQDAPLEKWIIDNISDVPAYKSTNYIPDINLSLANFEEFIKQRKVIMKKQLRKVLNIN
jgi:uncharacterized protein with ParB-like and HNH nuclease domain